MVVTNQRQIFNIISGYIAIILHAWKCTFLACYTCAYTCILAPRCTWNIGSLCRCWVMDRLMLGLKVMQAPAPSLSLTPLSSSREAPGLEVPNKQERIHHNIQLLEVACIHNLIFTYENHQELCEPLRTHGNHREL